MDVDMQFGDLEEAQPERRLRPDQNRHYAVVACQQPSHGELPIYVHLDVMLEIEDHARTNTNVELGGVLLGGQYEDEDGKPFVLVSDSLRAEHYEATKGSFKFTHETWEAISRQRDEFPEEFEMVGWYHTHPDWGVFLSGMDMFICDNFFNRPLDVALVVDPCRGDRGWFEWTGDATERIRRTDGFYLVSSRYRQAELEAFSCYLEESTAMSIDPRVRSGVGHFGSQGAPVVNITERDNSTQNIALWGMLLMQFLFLGLVAWRLTAPTGPTEEEKKTAADEQAEVKQLLEDINKTRASTVNREAQMYVLDQLVERIEGGDANLATSLQSSRAEAVRLRASLDSQIALTKSLELETEDQKLQISNLRIEKGNISKNLREVRGELADANNSNKELQTKIKDMENGDAYRPFYQDWKALTACALIAIVAAVGGTVLGYTLKREEEEDEEYTPRSNAFSAPKMSDVEPEVEPDDTTFQITDSDEGESPETDHQDENPKEQE